MRSTVVSESDREYSAGRIQTADSRGTWALLESWVSSRFGWRLLAEFGVMYLLLTVYRTVRTIKGADLVAAFSHAADVVRVERWLNLPSEELVQQSLLGRSGAIDFLNHYYVMVHFPAVFALVIWMYLRHPHKYPTIRNLLVVVTFLALIIHMAYPLAPPRMMESFVDTIQIYGPSVYPPSAFNGAANQIAAMPSLHFGWAAIEAGAVIWALSSRWRWLFAIHPVLMVLAIVGTANHWWLDAIVAGVLILVGLPLAIAVDRRWPHRSPKHEVAAVATPQLEPLSV